MDDRAVGGQWVGGIGRAPAPLKLRQPGNNFLANAFAGIEMRSIFNSTFHNSSSIFICEHQIQNTRPARTELFASAFA